MNKEIELLNCPCCNSKAKIYELPERLGGGYKGSCTKCGMRTCIYKNKKQVVKTWNRRKINA